MEPACPQCASLDVVPVPSAGVLYCKSCKQQSELAKELMTRTDRQMIAVSGTWQQIQKKAAVLFRERTQTARYHSLDGHFCRGHASGIAGIDGGRGHRQMIIMAG